jgi:alpha-tubulin suppressor-like RCC1 family protein
LVVFDDHTGRTSYDVSLCGEIVEICSGNGVTAVLSADHHLWLLGKMAKKTYGLEEPLTGMFKSVRFGTEHCLLLTTAGEVLALGSNGSGQLGA